MSGTGPASGYSAGAIADSVGVQTNLIPYPTMQPTDAAQLGALAAAAHIRHYRAGVRPADPVYWRNILAFNAASGARPMIVTDCKPPVGLSGATTAADLVAFNNDIGNSADAVEGVNEPDTRMSQDGSWSADLNSCEAALSGVLPLPFVAPSMAQAASYAAVGSIPNMNVANIHVYYNSYNPGNTGYGPKSGSCGNYGSLNFWKCLAGGEAGSGRPFYVTETGWNSEHGVDETTQAKYSTRAILFNYINGIARTYFYTLVSYPGADSFGGCGLLRADRSPKPAYNAIRTLLTALADDGPPYVPSAPKYSLTGASSSIMYVPMQKRDGTNVVALWNETLSYDPTTSQPVSVPSQLATLSIPAGQSVQSVIRIGDDGMATPILYAPSGTGGEIIPVDDHVTLVTYR